MKTNLPRLFAIITIAAIALASPAQAQRSLGTKKGPTSKLYLAEAVGESLIHNGDKIYSARQATAFDAPGTVIVTKAGAHNALVYSNGTGLFVDQNTRVEISRFVQEPFQPLRPNQRLDTIIEPSVSQSNVLLGTGAIGICTSQLISGSSMNYSTRHGNVNIRGGKVSIETNDNETHIDLLEGDATVRVSGGHDIGGHILRPGERATITPSLTGGQPTISVGPIPPAALRSADERIQTACNAKRSVTFEVIQKRAEEGLDSAEDESPATGETAPAVDDASFAEDEAAGAGDEGAASDQEIIARPTVPESPSGNSVVSPDRLPGTGS